MAIGTKAKISVVINTYNAEKDLHRVLESVKDFDEVVVCDMESTDKTVAIASEMGCKVVTFPKGTLSICEPARNFAIQSASNEWVLVVDADEIVTAELRDYLYQRVEGGDCPDGLFVPRHNMFLGKIIRSSNDYQLRMLRRDKVDWPPVIHRRPQVDGNVEYIRTKNKNVCLYHLYDANIQKRVEKINQYTNYEISKRMTKRYGVCTILFRPLWFFLRCLFMQGSVMEGKRGIIKAHMAALYEIIMISKIAENNIREKMAGSDEKDNLLQK